MGAGQIFGEDDLIANRPNSYSIFCKSSAGIAFRMKSDEFYTMMKSNPESWKIIVIMAMAKEKAINRRVN